MIKKILIGVGAYALVNTVVLIAAYKNKTVGHVVNEGFRSMRLPQYALYPE